MSLRNAFKTNAWLYKQALAEGDTALLEKLFLREMSTGFLLALVKSDSYAQVTQETASFLARNVTKDVEERWNVSGILRPEGVLSMICRLCIAAQETPEIVEAFIGGLVPPQKLAELTLKHIGHEADRLSLLDKIIKKDIACLHGVDKLARDIAARDMLPEFDLLVAAGFDLHKDNEILLRDLAAQKNKGLIVHAVKNHGADIDVAVNTARMAGHDQVHDYLAAVRADMYPEAKPLSSFEDMAREVTTLRSTVKDLQKMVADLGTQVQDLKNPSKALDKKPLQKPASF